MKLRIIGLVLVLVVLFTTLTACAGKEEKKITNKEIDNIVGIWANRFDKDEKSDEIKRKWRIKNWKRF